MYIEENLRKLGLWIVHSVLSPLSKDTDLMVHELKFTSCKQNAGQNHNIKVNKKSFKNVGSFKYIGMTMTKCKARRN
jgi:hypothetical protein